MGAPIHQYPPGDVRLLLGEARRLGLDFETAWERVVRPGRRKQGEGAVVTTRTPKSKRPDDQLCAVWPGDTLDRNAWREAVEETKDAWRRAYNGEPACRGELALAYLCDVLDGGRSRLPSRYREGVAA